MTRLKVAFLVAALLIVAADAILLQFARSFHVAAAADVEGQRLRLLLRTEGRRPWQDYEPYHVPVEALAKQLYLNRSPLKDPELGIVRARFFFKPEGKAGALVLGSPWFVDGLKELDPDDPAAEEKRSRFARLAAHEEALRKSVAALRWADYNVVERETVAPEVAQCAANPVDALNDVNLANSGDVMSQRRLEQAWSNTQSVNREAKRAGNNAQQMEPQRSYGSAPPSVQLAAPAYEVRATEFTPIYVTSGPAVCVRRVELVPTGTGRLPPLGPYYQGFQVDDAMLGADGVVTSSLDLSRRLTYGAAGLIFLLGTAGLYFLYGTVASRLELAERRSDFTAAVSHELKAPLAGIRALAELIHEGMVTSPAKIKEYVGNILHESERLSRLIGNVLDSARLERRERTYTVGAADPAPAIREAVEIFRTNLTARGFELAIDVPESLPPAMLDRDALVQAVANLIDNAAKYTAPCPVRKISVRASAIDGTAAEVAIDVEDSGIGIDDAERALLFTPYRRGRDPLAQGTGGAGLGLPIAKSHILAMGGRIDVASEKGKGSRFRVVLRRA